MAKSEAGGASKSANVTIVNRQTRIVRFPIMWVPDRFKDYPPHARRARMRVVRLNPGANTVDAADWKTVTGEGEGEGPDLTEGHVEDGEIFQVNKPIHTMPVSEAVEIVKLTIDKPILLGVQMKDQRKKVQTAVKKQLASLELDAHTEAKAS